MARVSVIFPPLRVSRDFIDYPYFADLGAVQAAGLLRDLGHDVDLVDALAMPDAALRQVQGVPGEVTLGAPLDACLERVGAADVFLVAYTPFHRPPERDPALSELIETLRGQHPTAPIVLADLYQSGQHVVDVPSSAILRAYPGVDFIVRYEAEQALPDLVTRLLSVGRPAEPEELRGIEVDLLDALPLPAWDLVDLEAYWSFHASVVDGLGRPRWFFPIGERALPMLSSRGCPYRCAHCSSNPGRAPGAAKRQRRYSRESLARHLDALASLGARRVHLLDELANVNERHFDALLELLAERDLSFEIPNGVRADHVREPQLTKMKGRITTLSVSAESGSQRVVDEVVGKDLDLRSITEVCQRAQTAGVPTLVHFMIGLPGETKVEINETLAYAMALHEETGAWPSVQYATPLPGTRLAEMPLAAGNGTAGAALPVVHDWGPRFQQIPSIATAHFTREELEQFRWTFDARLRAGEGPKKVILNATYKCNNRCTFCAVGTRSQFDGNYARQREFLLKYRHQGVELLDIDGGEPTLYPKLVPLVRFARKIGFQRVNVTTNGRMSSYEDYASTLVSSGVTSILFSIHGTDARMHAANVGVLDAFEQTLAGVRNTVRLAPPAVELGANITLTKTNYEHLDGVAALIHDLGLRWLNVQFLTPFGRATSTVNPDTQAAADVTMRVIDRWKDRIHFQVINLPFCYMPGYEKYLTGDLLKLERHMIFVNNEEVNLFEYLRERRGHREVCQGCTRRIFCGGFYELSNVPEPEWLIEEEDLVRPIAPEGLTPAVTHGRSLPVVG